jgi:hypothetical protein
VRIEVRHVTPPLFWLLLDIASEFPSHQADPEDGHPKGAELVGYIDETVVRPGFPVPIESRLGVIAKSLLALSKRIFGTLLVFDVGRDAVPFYNFSEFVTERLGAA